MGEGEKRLHHQILGRRALVIGGSISGMLSAKALSEFFEEVLIVEADTRWDKKTPRIRIPQGHHAHILLESGQRVLEQLFPGLIDELIQDGSVVTDLTNDFAWFHFGKWKRRFPGGIRGVQQTRPFLEWHINRRLKEVPNIHSQYDTLVTNLEMSSDKKRVTGVHIQNRVTGDHEEIPTDLVVDASGYGSQTLKWLGMESGSFLEEVKIGLFYATQFYTSDQSLEWKNLMISSQLPQLPYTGVVLSYEEDKFGVTLSGYLMEPPKTNEDFLHITKSLPVPHLYDFLQKATPISDMKIYRIPRQVRKRLDKLDMPSGIIVTGDACCRFDPIYGQGMSVAALEAEMLGQELSRVKTGEEWKSLSKTFHRKQFKITKNPWDMAITESFRHPEVSGKGPFGMGLRQKLVAKIYEASATQEKVYLELGKVMNLTSTPNVFFKPSMLVKLFLKGQ
jgi:2-polyprenyl-6-methoxyphenol hydroxylase-like FAD-dependent oxidoreductase